MPEHKRKVVKVTATRRILRLSTPEQQQAFKRRILGFSTPEQEQALIEERRKFAFLTASRSASRWFSNADRHKRAADIIYEVAHAAHQLEMARFLAEAKGGFTGIKSRTLEGEKLQDFLDSELLADYLLLAGYALECILKGCLLANQPKLVEDGKKLAKTVTTHNRERLCRDCGISLSPLERQVIDIIAWHVDWRKYPVPKKLEDMSSPVEPNPRSLDIPGSPFHKRKLQKLVDGLYLRGCQLLESLR